MFLHASACFSDHKIVRKFFGGMEHRDPKSGRLAVRGDCSHHWDWEFKAFFVYL